MQKGGVIVYLDIEFTKEGTTKLEKISKDYVTIEKTEENKKETEENTEENQSEEEVKQKEVVININGTQFMSTSFSEPITNGKLTISMGNETSDSEELNDFIKQAQHYATILSNGEVPLTYAVESSEYIQSDFSKVDYQYVLIGIVILLVVLSIIYMVIRYKKLGLLSSLIYLATIALLSIIARYTKVEFSLETMISAIILVFINTFINCSVLGKIAKNDNKEERSAKLRKEYIKISNLLIIALIPAIVFTYNVNAAISSIGIVLFWGIACIVAMNLLFARKLLLLDVKK